MIYVIIAGACVVLFIVWAFSNVFNAAIADQAATEEQNRLLRAELNAKTLDNRALCIALERELHNKKK